MNKVNYDAQMNEIIAGLGESKPRLLLHVCCAPCSSACLERLFNHFEITALFYNPNIEDEEYLKRKRELLRLLEVTGWATVLDCDHDTQEFYGAVRGLEHCKEGGERCTECFKLRLKRTARLAGEGGFDYFATTLTLSPLKDADRINRLGTELAVGCGAKWLPNDFKKRDGYRRSIELSREHGLYRQNYCGCVYSRQTLDNLKQPVIK